MKQKLTALFLTLVLSLSLAAPALAAPDTLPKVGDTIHGFTITERATLDLTGAPTVTLKHVLSGATLYYVASDDLNRTFGVTFRTPALDDRGMSHILEHGSLSGGEKYPCPNLFFAAANQTYNTFVNAMTAETTTTYPVSSLSEDQLFRLADLYLDGIFRPMLKTDKRVFDREAWRYSLTDANSPITITGTVYNEMKGAMDITRSALNSGVKTLFPGTILGSNSGGAPEAIPTLTHEALVAYHDTYYHPSNALFFLNGAIDLNRFLAFLDESYLSGFQTTDVSPDLGTAVPLTAPAFARYEYAVEQDAPTDKGAVVTYAMAAPGATRDEGIALNLLTDLLSDDTSPVCRAVTEALPGAQLSAHVSLDFAQPYVLFYAEGLNEDDATVFRDAVDRGLQTFAATGPAKGAVCAVAGSALLSYRFLSESAQFGPSLLSMTASRWTTEGTLDYLNYYGAALERIKKADDGKWFAALAQKYLVKNPWSALTVTVPVPGLKEQREAAQTKDLAALKASLTPAEVAAMVKSTADFNAWSAQEPTAQDVAALTAVSVKTLPEDLRQYDVTDRTRDGVRSLTVESSSDGLGAAAMMLDLSAFENEDLLWANLYSNLVGKLDTDTHTATELSALIPQVLGSFSSYATSVPTASNGERYKPSIAVQWVGSADDLQGSLALVGELLFRTDITDVSALQSQISALLARQKSRLNSEPTSVQSLRAQALIAPQKYAAYNYMTGLDFYAFLGEVDTRLTVNPAEVTAKLTAIQTALTNRQNALTQFAGNKDAIAAWNKASTAFWKSIPQTKTSPADRSTLPTPAGREGVVAEANVQYNMLAAPLSALGLKDSGKLDVAGTVLNDRYLTPQTRHIIGAYGSSVSINEDGLALSTYRDPALAKTYEVFAASADAMSTMTLSQAELDGYIMSCYSSLARPRGTLTGAMNAMSYHLMGRDSGDTLRRMREMKTTTLSDVRAFSGALNALNEVGFRSTVGGAAILEENAALFDTTLYPNGKSDSAMTRAEALAVFPGTVLLGDGNGNLNESSPITRQELAVLLYRCAGSPPEAVSAEVVDLPQVSPWAREAVLWAVGTGALALDEDGYFHPTGEVERTEVG